MLQYQTKCCQICPNIYGVDATSIRLGKDLTSLGVSRCVSCCVPWLISKIFQRIECVCTCYWINEINRMIDCKMVESPLLPHHHTPSRDPT